MSKLFNLCARVVSQAVGSPVAFIVAFGSVVVWAAFGPISGFSDSWMLVVNTGTTIVTFLMVFLIQSTTNRETKAINLKLDELTLAIREAKNTVVAAEQKDDTVLAQIEAEHIARVKSTSDIT